MKPTETRATSATGGMKGLKLPRLGGTDPQAMMELARVYGMGEMKYERYNYLKGYPWSQSVDALLRHLFAFLDGEDYDECTIHADMHGNDHEYDPDVCDGSGLLHTSHVAWHGLTLTSFVQRGIGTDDRAPRRPAECVKHDDWFYEDGDPIPSGAVNQAPLILGHPIEDVIRWKAEYDMLQPPLPFSNPLAQEPEDIMGLVGSWPESSTTMTIVPQPVEQPHCWNASCIKGPHEGDVHEDWLGAYCEEPGWKLRTVVIGHPDQWGDV